MLRRPVARDRHVPVPDARTPPPTGLEEGRSGVAHRRRDRLVVALTLSSGAVDAICFLALGKVFSAFMTGNLVFLGLGIAGSAGSPLSSVGTAVGAFMLGVYCSMRLVIPTRGSAVWPRRVTLALTLSLTGQLCFAVVWFVVSGHPSLPVTNVLLGFAALAMGCQTAAVFSLGILGVFTTAATATLTVLIGNVAHSQSTRPDRRLLATVLLALVAGATLGGLLVLHTRRYAPLLPLLITAAVVVTAAVVFGGRRPTRVGAPGPTDQSLLKRSPAMATTASVTVTAPPPDGRAEAPPALTDGFHLLVDALKLNGVETIYGVAGIPVTDLARLAQASGIRYIGFRHEASAGNAAAAAGFLTQRPGVSLTVSAPGFLNGLVSVANATTNCFPMVQISGSSDRALVDLQRGEYEELDQMAAAKPFAKAAYRIDRAEDIGLGVARAFRTAVSGRPGGVYLDVPGAVLAEAMDAAAGAGSLWALTDPSPRQLPAPEAVDRALALLAEAQRPLVVLGKGAAYAQADDTIRTFLESTGIPFLPMSMAKGLLPDDHPQSVAAARSIALAEADVVMLVGARLNWLLGQGASPEWSPDARFIQVDIEARELDSNRATAAPLVGDIGSVMAALIERALPGRVTVHPAWRDQLEARKVRNAASMEKRLAEDPRPMRFYNALRAVRDVLTDRPDVYLVNEGANALDITRNVIDMQRPRHRLDTGTWGVMGVGMGYAIAAAVETGAPVVAIEGDSAFGFSGMELETICRYQLPVTVVILNNGGIYRGDGVNRASADPSPTVLAPDAHHDRLIEAFGGVGHRATTPQELSAALTEALAAGRPALIDCVLDPAAGTESGHIANLNPKSAIAPAPSPSPKR